MAYDDGTTLWPGGIDPNPTHAQGDEITPNRQTYITNLLHVIQSILGIDPHASSGTVANRLNTGTFPALAVAGVSVLNSLLTVNGNIDTVSTLARINIRDSNNTGQDIRAQVNLQDSTATTQGRIGYINTSDGAVHVENLLANENIQLATAGAGYVRVGTPSAQAGPAAGDLNAVRLFSNGTLVTCYPLEAAYGTLDPAEWDALVPDDEVRDADDKLIGTTPRNHEPARKFAQRNDLDLEDWCARLKARQALPNFPQKHEWPAAGKLEIGDYIQRLHEQLEVQAVHIEALHKRVATLEAR